MADIERMTITKRAGTKVLVAHAQAADDGRYTYTFSTYSIAHPEEREELDTTIIDYGNLHEANLEAAITMDLERLSSAMLHKLPHHPEP